MRGRIAALAALLAVVLPVSPAFADSGTTTASCNVAFLAGGTALFHGDATDSAAGSSIALRCTYSAGAWSYEVNGSGVQFAVAAGVTIVPPAESWTICTRVVISRLDPPASSTFESCRPFAVAESNVVYARCDHSREARTHTWVIEAIAVASTQRGVPLTTEVACTLHPASGAPMTVRGTSVTAVAAATGALPATVGSLASKCIEVTVWYHLGAEPVPYERCEPISQGGTS